MISAYTVTVCGGKMTQISIRFPVPMRLDKYISQVSEYSRKEVLYLVRSKSITVDGQLAKTASMKVCENALVCIGDETLGKPGPRYFMLNKPEGYVSVTKDHEHPTALELLNEHNADQLQIAGRLDLDTTGLLLITDDGKWNHAVTSPKRDCKKTYYVTLAHNVSEDTEEQFTKGVMLEGELKPTQPAMMETLFANEVRLTISEGKYHQVKRMFAAVGNKVDELHRERIGHIDLDPDLAPGEYRPLTHAEINSVKI